jgi:hypothetical protein
MTGASFGSDNTRACTPMPAAITGQHWLGAWVRTTR